MAVAADGDPGYRPLGPDAADEPADVERTSTPDGVVLPGLSTMATGRPVAVS